VQNTTNRWPPFGLVRRGGCRGFAGRRRFAARLCRGQGFVAAAFAHYKYIGIGADAKPLFAKAGIADDLDEACLPLGKPADAKAFITACRALRYWPRELAVDLDAKPAAKA